jgi:hypothetical protein
VSEIPIITILDKNKATNIRVAKPKSGVKPPKLFTKLPRSS